MLFCFKMHLCFLPIVVILLGLFVSQPFVVFSASPEFTAFYAIIPPPAMIEDVRGKSNSY